MQNYINLCTEYVDNMQIKLGRNRGVIGGQFQHRLAMPPVWKGFKMAAGSKRLLDSVLLFPTSGNRY